MRAPHIRKQKEGTDASSSNDLESRNYTAYRTTEMIGYDQLTCVRELAARSASKKAVDTAVTLRIGCGGNLSRPKNTFHRAII